jgi:PucR family transcriptional regulator, purine catabolism regulatory protein
VLSLPLVRRGMPEVMAGEDLLDREIRWVHPSEAPNIASLLAGGELLLTTGMGIGRGAAAQRRLVEELSERGVAALAVELGTAFEQMPPDLLDAARRRDLPLIAFHRELPFVAVTEAVHRAIIDHGGELQRRGEELHRRFTSLMLGGAKVPDVLAELATFVANPVVLERAGQGVVFHACSETDDAAVLAAWAARDLDSAPDTLQERVPMGGGDTWGRLAVLALETPLEDVDRVAVERAVGLIALALVRSDEGESLASQQRGSFLAGLRHSRAAPAEIAARARELGFCHEGLLLPIAVAPPDGLDPGDPAWLTVAEDLRLELEQQAIPVLIGHGDGAELLLLLGLRFPARRLPAADTVAAELERSASRRLESPTPLTVAVAPAAASWLDVGAALALASGSLAAAASSRSRPWHDLGVPSTDRLLFSLRDQPELERFAELRLRPLLDADRGGRGELLRTLSAFCEQAGRKAATAQALGIRRQSLYHRLRRIEQALDCDLEDGETRLSLHLALRSRVVAGKL